MCLARAAAFKMGKGMGNARGEAIGKLDVYLETTLADRRSEGGLDLARLRAQPRERPHAFAADISQRAAPSGVQRSNCSLVWIVKQNRHAIGG